MRSRSLVSALVGTLLATAPAAGAPLASAELRLAISTLPVAVFTADGASGNAASDLVATLAPGSAFAGTYSTILSTNAAPPLTKLTVRITQNQAASFTGATRNSVGAVAKIGGSAGAFGIGAKLLDVPLSLGLPSTFTKAGGGVAITTISGPWTVGTAAVTGLAGTPTATAMGFNGLTPGGGGMLVLVTPVKIVTNISPVFAAFGTLELVYVPEPGSLPLLGLGVAGLVALARRRL